MIDTQAAEKERLDRLVQTAGIYATLCGLCAGFTFTATLFLIQFNFSLGNLDLYLIATSALTLVFIFATLSYSATAAWVMRKDSERAMAYFRFGAFLALNGIFSLAIVFGALIYLKSMVAGIITWLLLLAIPTVGVIFFDTRHYVGKYLKEKGEKSGNNDAI